MIQVTKCEYDLGKPFTTTIVAPLDEVFENKILKFNIFW